MKVKRWDLFVIFVGHEWKMVQVSGVVRGVGVGMVRVGMGVGMGVVRGMGVGVGEVVVGGVGMGMGEFVEEQENVVGVFRLIYGDDYEKVVWYFGFKIGRAHV